MRYKVDKNGQITLPFEDRPSLAYIFGEAAIDVVDNIIERMSEEIINFYSGYKQFVLPLFKKIRTSYCLLNATALIAATLPNQSTPSNLPTTTRKVVEVVVLPAPSMAPIGITEQGPMQTKLVNFGSLSKRNLGHWLKVPEGDNPNLNSLLTGVEGIAPAYKMVNYCHQLELAWNAKSGRRGGISGATKKTRGFTVDQYCTGTRTYMSFNDYLTGVQSRIETVRPNIDFSAICAEKEISRDNCQLVQKMESVITAEFIGSYGMTELTPSMNAEHNFRILDHLMSTAGVEYVMSFPALFDKLGSRGLFQFTYMGHSNSPEHGREGGAKILPHVPRTYRIPESVMGNMGLKTFDHDRAAHYFMLNNAADLVAKLNASQRSALWRVLNDVSRRAELLEFYATSHHAPADIRNYARNWLTEGARKSFHQYLRGRFVKYGSKSLGGYHYLTTHHGDVS